MTGAFPDIRRRQVLTRWAGFCALVCTLGGCVTNQVVLEPPPPYMLLPVDEMASCEAISASFMFSAKRAARIEYWLSVGRWPGYGYDRFPLDAPRELVEERRRMDALTDLQRDRGCVVLEPTTAVINERAKLEGWDKRVRPLVVLHSRG
jgi:hypothetical protein